MSNPVSTDLHVSSALTDVSIAYMQDANKYIANRVFGSTPVAHSTNTYHTYTKNDWLRDEVQKHSAGDNTPIGGFGTGTDTYSCDSFRLGTELFPEDIEDADEVFDLKSDKAEWIAQQFLNHYENKFASTFMTTSTWATDKTPSTLWDDDASDPLADVIEGSQAIEKTTGFRPNTLVVTREIHDVLRQHPLLLDQHKYTSAESITADMIARYLDVDRYFIMSAIKATNVEGGTEAYDYVEDSNALLCYHTPRLTRKSVTAAHNFVWKGLTGQNDLGFRMDEYPDPDREATIIRGKASYDMKVVASDLGYLFNGAIA